MVRTESRNGTVIHQITQAPRLVSNVYCERPFCSADSKRFLYQRQTADPEQWEYVLCEFGTWKEEVVGVGFHQISISYEDDFYFNRWRGKSQVEFVRLCMATAKVEPVWTCPKGETCFGHPTVSKGGRRLAYHYPISYDPQRFGIAVVDLRTSERNTIYEHPHVCNAHLQFHPTDERELMVQLNRGCVFTPQGERLKLVGPEGATLLLLDAVSGATEPLQIGKPHTPAITGHQAWVGNSRQIITTVAAEGDCVPVPGKGNVLLVERGKPCRQLGTGVFLGHIGSTPCGRYFFGDRPANDYIVIGSPVTSRTVTVHNDPLDPGPKDDPFGQQSHPHAYLTPDFRWMVFNSDRTGTPQVYVAEIPPGFLDGLDGK